ncbi:hypothetical protein Acr_08g0005220 [Actinidia rufa]|uniref:Transmembrane protein n=1 Tax=Actinidia rufa TaxID=165716 RepID=A0A7J0F0Y1_9ERIC|nr:hypothetical protein Acr_08g0005220 [Actinidia rufa]
MHPVVERTTSFGLYLNKFQGVIMVRFKNAVTLQLSQSSFSIFASSSNPSDQDPLKEKSDEIKTGDASQGPPFLTILAGLLVFLVVCWIIGSILLWLIGLIFHSPPTK